VFVCVSVCVCVYVCAVCVCLCLCACVWCVCLCVWCVFRLFINECRIYVLAACKHFNAVQKELTTLTNIFHIVTNILIEVPGSKCDWIFGHIESKVRLSLRPSRRQFFGLKFAESVSESVLKSDRTSESMKKYI